MNDSATGRFPVNSSFLQGLQGPVFCEPFALKVVSSGYFTGEDPIQFTLPILLLQLGTCSFLSAIMHFIFKPLGLPKFISDILGGIIIGPSVLGQSAVFNQILFSDKSLMVLDVYEQLSVMIFAFLIGLNTDLSVFTQSPEKSIVMGLVTSIFPLVSTTFLVAYMMENIVSFPQPAIFAISVMEAIVNYKVISVILTDLKLVNSDLGRLALSSSMISTLGTLSAMVIRRTVVVLNEQILHEIILETISQLALVLAIIFVFRPLTFWMIDRTPEGKTLKESYICTILVTLLLITFLSEVLGVHYVPSAIIMGMAVPGGPPLASGLIEKLELFMDALLIPSLVLNIGRKVNIFDIRANTLTTVLALIVIQFSAKLVASMLPTLYWNITLKDGFCVGLLMNCQGLLDLYFFSRALLYQIITEEMLSVMVIAAVLHSATVTILLKNFYDPSRKLLASRIRTIQECPPDSEFKILACVHHEESVTSLVNILEASHPTRESPIVVFVLDLVELAGRSVPLFITHQLEKITSTKSTRTQRIITAFKRYQARNEGLASVNCFTSIAPFATIHEDICTLALENSTCLVLTSYKKSDEFTTRTLNKNILQNSPCSVAIFVEPGKAKDTRIAERSWFEYSVCVLFIGGADDREALAYGTRMAAHPNIALDVIRVTVDNYHETSDLNERAHDLNALNQFKVNTVGITTVIYQEENVTDGTGTTRLLQAVKGADYDLVLVGRRHDETSPALQGLADWSEIKEFGIVGDMLSVSDHRCNAGVLIVQKYDSLQEHNISIHGILPAETLQAN